MLQFGRRKDPARELEKLKRKVESFMRPSSALVDSRDLTIPEKRRRYTLFIYGAIGSLTASQGLNETHRLALLAMYLGSVKGMHEREINYLVGCCTTLTEQPDDEKSIRSGTQAMEEWLSDKPGDAVSRLAETLREPC
ncbi:MAG: hypothetical protein GY731_12600 [Gammaproteobacteria bacterium]|nr:hypothetical protein [Gammaproteobacteria bacterium]